MKAKEGRKVYVFSPDQKEDWGKGTIIKVGDLKVEGLLISTTYPTIKLDDGRELGGLDCWWYPIEAEE